jgi:hypothetical protein
MSPFAKWVLRVIRETAENSSQNLEEKQTGTFAVLSEYASSASQNAAQSGCSGFVQA